MRVIHLALLTSFLPVPHLAAQTADTVRFTPTVGYPTFAVNLGLRHGDRDLLSGVCHLLLD